MPQQVVLSVPAAGVRVRPERTRSVLVAYRPWRRSGATSIDLRPRNTVSVVAARRARPLMHAASTELLPRGLERRPVPRPDPGHRNAIVLGAFAVLVVTGAGFVSYRRLRA